MRAEDFAGQWDYTENPVVKFKLNTAMAKNLDEELGVALREYGLPKTAEPWLNFMEFALVDEGTASALNELNFYPIGYLANGDIICIEKASKKIMICDHEDMSYTWMLNSSIEALYDSLVLFRNFMAQVNEANPDFACNFKIPDGMLESLAENLKLADGESYAEKGFWFTEVQALSD